jgi:two-component system, OmpR family, phosphate regulon sensor histidine kinase PhoR
MRIPPVSTPYSKKIDASLTKVESQSQAKPLFASILLNHIETAACCLNAEAQFIYVNPALCQLLESSEQELETIALYNLESTGSPNLWQQQWQLLKQKRSLVYPTQYQLKSGALLLAKVKMTYVIQQEQELICVVISTESPSTQITTHASSPLEKHNPLNDIKSQFVPIICHQFRSLLNVISLSNSLLKRNLYRWSPAEKQPYLEHIQNAVDQVTQLLEQSVLFGKSITGGICPKPVPIDLNQFCHELIDQLQPVLDAQQQKIILTLSDEGCIADSYLLSTIFTNLLSNASKYSPSNTLLHLTVLGQSHSLDVQIQDAGIGISANDQQRLFEPFYRCSNVGDRPGMGLGLALVKNIIESQGGKIKLTSTPGIGTTVAFSLPLLP